ncbi:hypothetical protein GFH30_06520 [Acinetobacter wanghuae]|uniref:Uncharacterized protein n=1 Tax=Acinetobacter wanghuae TaxID=2662362 RepID=A0A5Q0P387_9GAMM|nr:hypothetical protein [Acinetobacter wanghuae]MQW92599.1 hypothetical protein [Acinetobacter wanghuae]QGA11062.1 hypothetical protein GFH30_06520 [Acinetobacter wanghuae]
MATILSATATFFAAFVAIILYTDWRAPQYLQKISYESREIFKVSRQLKLKADQLLELVNTRLATTNLNNDNTDSLKYKSIIKNLLDDIDDLANLLVMYK